MTNVRMVFLVQPSDQEKSQCQTIEIPFRGIWNEKFNQPIFGCNNLTSNVRYYDEQPFVGELKVGIDFIQGGVNTFLPLFNNVLHSTRVQMRNEQLADANVSPVSAPTDASAESYFPNHNAAFVDPQDPSHIYTTQPVSQSHRQDAPAWSVSKDGLRKR